MIQINTVTTSIGNVPVPSGAVLDIYVYPVTTRMRTPLYYEEGTPVLNGEGQPVLDENENPVLHGATDNILDEAGEKTYTSWVRYDFTYSGTIFESLAAYETYNDLTGFTPPYIVSEMVQYPVKWTIENVDIAANNTITKLLELYMNLIENGVEGMYSGTGVGTCSVVYPFQ